MQILNVKSWRRLGLLLCIPALVLGIFINAFPVKAAVGGKRAAVLMPFAAGGKTGFESPATHTPYSTNYGFYTSWDIHGGASTAVYPRVNTGDGSVSMKIVNVYNSSNGAGQGVDVEVTVGGVYVGKLRYAHLVNLGVTNGQTDITTGTRLGDTAPDQNFTNTSGTCKGFYCSSSWQVTTVAGIHTHMEFSKACYGPQGTQASVGSSTGIALLSENYAASNHGGCDTAELDSVAAGTQPGSDSDADGVDDANDWCPYVKGTATNKGCPNSVTQLSGDINGDGKDDVVAISRGNDNAPGISWFQSTSTVGSPSVASAAGLMSLPAPAWNVNGLKWAVGDFNGDGKDDLFAASGLPGTGPNLYIFLSTGTGLASPVLVKQPNPAYWLWDRLEFFANDLNGDGKDDIVAVSRGNDNAPGISWFQSTSSGSTASLADAVGVMTLTAPAWNTNNLKWAMGDFNGDGKDDVFVASGSQVDPPNMYILTSNGSALNSPVLVKQPNPAYWKWERLTFMAANLDGDSKDDILAVSRGLDNAPGMSWFQSASTASTTSLADAAGLIGMTAPAWNVSNLKWAVIDADGNGQDDLFAASGTLNSGPNLYIFPATGSGASSVLASPTLVSQPNPAYWLWDRLQF